MIEIVGTTAVYRRLEPLIDQLERVLGGSSIAPEIAAQAALDDFLARPGCREWLAGLSIPSERPSLLRVGTAGRFSVLLYEWRPGGRSTVHDHWCWGAVGAVAGVEEETRYALTGPGRARPLFSRLLRPGASATFPAGPAGLHRVACHGDQPARSLHVYGGDLSTTGLSSIDRIYDEVGAATEAGRRAAFL